MNLHEPFMPFMRSSCRGRDLRLTNLGCHHPRFERPATRPRRGNGIRDRRNGRLLRGFDLVQRIQLDRELLDLRVVTTQLAREATVFIGEHEDSLPEVVGLREPVARFGRRGHTDGRERRDLRAVDGGRLCGEGRGTQDEECGGEH